MDNGTSSLDVQIEAEFGKKFDLNPEKVFDAWINPELATKWLFTTDSSDPAGRIVEIDPHVGGKYVIADRRKAMDIKADGEYLEIDRPHRLKFTLRIAQFSLNVDPVEVNIKPLENGCELSAVQTLHLTHDPNHDESVRKAIDESDRTETIKRWNEMLELLASRVY